LRERFHPATLPRRWFSCPHSRTSFAASTAGRPAGRGVENRRRQWLPNRAGGSVRAGHVTHGLGGRPGLFLSCDRGLRGRPRIFDGRRTWVTARSTSFPLSTDRENTPRLDLLRERPQGCAATIRTAFQEIIHTSVTALCAAGVSLDKVS
jgi:hypothetical protein